jgi:hypothetical protein
MSAAPTFVPDFSKATLSGEELTKQLAAAQAQASAAITSATTAVSGSYWWVKWVIGGLIAVVLLFFLADYISVKVSGSELTGFGWLAPTSTPEPTPPNATAAAKPVAKSIAPPSVFSRIYSSVFSGSSPNLAPNLHDATTSVSIPGKNAPLSDGPEGGYSIQWWMYVKDWNYGYGKPKSVIRRPDATSPAIMNPDISLHPTDNSLRVSVSVYPSEEGGAGKAQPAPAGHSGSSDDVFVCEVPNIPLQAWFSVSLSVFGRNMDIYIDGKLVKSCFLSGVPKPAVGDIQLTPGGGFSGNVCTLQHYARMLTPADAIAFWSAGTPCKNQTTPSGASSATGYSIKFGMYDALGKTVQQYTF